MTTTETFYVENIKCGGCANSIKASLGRVLGVQGVDVYVEKDKICVMGIGLNRTGIKEKLSGFCH